MWTNHNKNLINQRNKTSHKKKLSKLQFKWCPNNSTNNPQPPSPPYSPGAPQPPPCSRAWAASSNPTNPSQSSRSPNYHPPAPSSNSICCNNRRSSSRLLIGRMIRRGRFLPFRIIIISCLRRRLIYSVIGRRCSIWSISWMSCMITCGWPSTTRRIRPSSTGISSWVRTGLTRRHDNLYKTQRPSFKTN